MHQLEVTVIDLRCRQIEIRNRRNWIAETYLLYIADDPYDFAALSKVAAQRIVILEKPSRKRFVDDRDGLRSRSIRAYEQPSAHEPEP